MASKNNPYSNSNSQWDLDMDLEGSAITQEQIRDVYMAGTSDGIQIRGKDQEQKQSGASAQG